ncbi:MAG: lipid-A-disaccharide synthase [Phycisphaerae bacterium]
MAETPLIFISAAEPSADVHAAALIRAVHARCSRARFVGVAGPRMAEAGCDRLFDFTDHAAMLLGVVKVAGRAARMVRTCDAALRGRSFDAAVVLDSPTLHLPLAARAHALDIPVLYYIAPQLWAWGANRIHKLRNDVDRVAVILPFEERYFRDRGVRATYVGHPLAERVAASDVDPRSVERIRGDAERFVALLPGSRRHVVEAILPGQLDVARQIAESVRGVRFGVSVAGESVAPLVQRAIASAAVPVTAHSDEYAALIAAADLVLVASGTSTLEVVFHRRPMVVMYNASRLFYQTVGRWLIRTPYLSLPNILAGRRIVPEFMPYYTSTEPIAARAIELLQSDDARRAMMADLETIVRPLRDTRASQATADLLLQMIGSP